MKGRIINMIIPEIRCNLIIIHKQILSYKNMNKLAKYLTFKSYTGNENKNVSFSKYIL